MQRLFRRSQHQVALPPGTVRYVEDRKVEQVRLRVTHYDPETCEETETTDHAEALAILERPGMTWIDVVGLHETDMLQDLGARLGLHPLVLEDIVNVHQRPKHEDFQDYIYVVLRMLDLDAERNHLTSEQLSVVLGPGWVLTFQEREGDVFGPVRERLRRGKGRIRKAGPAYLAYALIDAVVDHYFVLLERFGEMIENLEEQLVENPTEDLLHAVHGLKREAILLRRAVWPTREVIGGLERSDSALVPDEVGVFLRDVYDHTIQVVDGVESFRDLLSGLQDLYLSSISNKMNEVMKVLTIAATIFVPLTFVAGIYGMNFEHMPELGWKWSYLIFWIVILGLGGGMLTFFRRRRYI